MSTFPKVVTLALAALVSLLPSTGFAEKVSKTEARATMKTELGSSHAFNARGPRKRGPVAGARSVSENRRTMRSHRAR
jgi:hypothetical protein